MNLPPICTSVSLNLLRSSHACTVHRTLLDDEVQLSPLQHHHRHRHHHHVKVWVLGGFNEDYNWQEGEEGFLSTTEVALVINIIFASPELPLSPVINCHLIIFATPLIVIHSHHESMIKDSGFLSEINILNTDPLKDRPDILQRGFIVFSIVSIFAITTIAIAITFKV